MENINNIEENFNFQERFEGIMRRLEKQNECRECGRQLRADGGCNTNACNE